MLHVPLGCISNEGVHDMTKTPGQIAYEQDVVRQPSYLPRVDGTRLPRLPWNELGAIERWSWEKNPTPRKW
jgi:hypothetical protein